MQLAESFQENMAEEEDEHYCPLKLMDLKYFIAFLPSLTNPNIVCLCPNYSTILVLHPENQLPMFPAFLPPNPLIAKLIDILAELFHL